MSHPDIRVLILGMDGYLGWCLYRFLQEKGVGVTGIDNFSRRTNVHMVGSNSLFPLGGRAEIINMDISKASIDPIIEEFRPTAIVHLAEQPSAPYSMRSESEAVYTQKNNVCGTMRVIWSLRKHPHIHLIKLGTMGEYGDWIYDRVPIPESSRIKVGWYEGHLSETLNISDYRIPVLEIPTPRWAGSFYHWSKVFDSFNLEFACRLWNLQITDLNQGVVYGTRLDCMSKPETRFDYDSYFGTAINRMVVQAVLNVPLTVYGVGGQTRGFININDSIEAMWLMINSPPSPGEFRVINQLTSVERIIDLARKISDLKGGHLPISHIPNPRVEQEEHFYAPRYSKLKEMGLTEPRKIDDELPKMMEDVEKFKLNIRREVILPETNWR